MIAIDCPLCGINKYRAIFTLNNDKSMRALDSLSVSSSKKVMCENCGLVYQNPRFDRQELGILYKTLARSKKMGYESDQPSSDYLEWKRKNAQKDLNWLEAKAGVRLPRESRVLDIGCAEGSLLRLYKAKGLRPLGIEPTDSYAEFGRRNFGLDIKSGFFDEINIESDQFDLASLMKILEHAQDPLILLSRVNSILKDGAFIYISVPNIYKPRIDFSEFIGSHHLTLFSVHTLSLALMRSGFEVVKIDDKDLELRVLGKKNREVVREAGHSLKKDNYLYLRAILIKQAVKSRVYAAAGLVKKHLKKLLPG